LNQTINEWMSDQFRSFQASKLLIMRALRHLSGKERASLFGKNERLKSTPIGKLYESVVYERLLELTNCDARYSVLRKGADIWPRNRTSPKLGQDGLFYDETGAIVARGNGQDLAEFDILVMNSQNEICYVEVKTSKSYLDELDLDVAYKRRLLEYLFSKPIQFVLLSCVEIRNKPAVKRTMNTPSSLLVTTAPIDSLLKVVGTKGTSGIDLRQDIRPRPLLLWKLNVRKFNYFELHEQCREELINATMSRRTVDFKGESWLIKRILVGYLKESSMVKLVNEKSIIVGKEKLTSKNCNAFPRTVLALRMPAFRPEIYLKLPIGHVYWKMGPTNTSTFEFERNIRRRNTEFLDWLESVRFEIEPEVMDRIMDEYLKQDVVGRRRKKGESQDISWLKRFH